MLGLILDEVNKRISFLGIPDSVLQFLIALFASVAFTNSFLRMLFKELINKYSWTSLQPETLLMVMLPPLLFESSFKINPHLFFAKIYLIVSLTVVAYYVHAISSPLLWLRFWSSTVLLIGYEFSFEGESLLNDGLALFTYRILESALEVELGISKQVRCTAAIFVVVMSVVGSPVIGTIGARVVAWIIAKLQENKKRQYSGLLSSQPIPPRSEFTILAYAGLRGALGLILAMELRNKVREGYDYMTRIVDGCVTCGQAARSCTYSKP
ncbi:hypothetical protein OSTOST_25983 [Ostertagia ostertagi]